MASEPFGRSYDERIGAFASVQHGAVSRAQLVAAGIPAHAIDYRVRVRRLHRLHVGVYRVGPIAPRLQTYSAAVLASGDGACVSHGSALEIWLGSETDPQLAESPRPASSPGARSESSPSARPASSPGARPESSPSARPESFSSRGPRRRVHVTIPPHRSVRRVAVIMHRGVIRGDEATHFEGLPVATPARTLLDLSPSLTSRELEQMVAQMRRRGLLRDEQLRRLVDRYPNRPGAPRLRALLESEAPLDLTRSEAEERLLALVRRARLPPPRTNARLAGYEVDLLWRGPRLVVEVDGFAYHGSRAAFEADRLRDAALAASGFRVMRVTWRQLEDEPEAVIARIATALAGAVPVGP